MDLEKVLSEVNKACDNVHLRSLLSLLVTTVQDQEAQISELRGMVESLTSRVDNPDMPEWMR